MSHLLGYTVQSASCVPYYSLDRDLHDFQSYTLRTHKVENRISNCSCNDKAYAMQYVWCAKRERQAAGAVGQSCRNLVWAMTTAEEPPSSLHAAERQQLERNYEPRPRRADSFSGRASRPPRSLASFSLFLSRFSLFLPVSLSFRLSLSRNTIPRTLEKSISLRALIHASLWFLTTC